MKLDKWDRLWSLQVRERDRYVCQRCSKQKDKYTAHAHHIIRRSIWATRYVVDNGITLCFQCHTANHTFSAHKTPTEFKNWFNLNWPERMLKILELSKKYMTKSTAIKEFLINI